MNRNVYSNKSIQKLQLSFISQIGLTVFVALAVSVKNDGYFAEARTVPVSRSFRFPSSGEDNDSFHTVPAFDLKGFHNQDTTSFLTAHARRANIPDSAMTSLEVRKDSTASSAEDSLSAEVLDAGANSGEEKPEEAHQDDGLREVLCSPINDLDGNETREDGSPAALNNVRYDLRAGKCGEVGSRVHCGKNMIFVAEIDSSAYGYCECDFENKILRKAGKKHELEETTTPLVFHPQTNACYGLYEQAYCANGEWLILCRNEKGPVCEKRRCPAEEAGDVKPSLPSARGNRRRASKLLTPEFWTEAAPTTKGKSSEKANPLSDLAGSRNVSSTWVPLNGTGPCVKLNEESLKSCEPGERVLFIVGDIVPRCGVPGRNIEGRAIVRNACPPGSFYSIIGRCQPDWDF